ncbi:hypothetical protein L7D48_00175 [Streptomyces sp. S1A]|uniref:MAB_1171c family putative transporter n=1 Tax=Streptomyces sp. ICN903 TaxID=2964654 RepID=UPI001EDAD458|nr:MAB_1171c family putative transporter [Streptomyces sp. ICN903]MCG3039002.1 hypothetical protein [Streptomyces sp. ICN903]
MTDVLPALLLWSVTAWRAPSAWRDRRKRTLWTVFLALSVVMTVRPLPVAHAMDRLLHVNNLSFLVKHLCGIVAAAAVLSFVNDMSERRTPGLKGARLHAAVPATAAAAITALFFATPQPFEATDILTDYADDWRIAAYGTVWTAYLGTALLSATRLCRQWGRQSGTGLLEYGLRCTGAGTAVGMLYTAHRIVALLLNHFGRNPVPARLDDRVSDLLLLGSLLLILVGSTLPALQRLRQWWRDYRDLLSLHPFWYSLTEAVPSVRLDPPRSRTAERLHLRDAHVRLYRRTIEIRDAMLALGDYTSRTLLDRARSHVEANELTGARADVAAEACRLAAAREAKLRGEPASGEHHPPTGGGRDLPSEIEALKQLAEAYASDLTKAFVADPDRTRTAETSA